MPVRNSAFAAMLLALMFSGAPAVLAGGVGAVGLDGHTNSEGAIGSTATFGGGGSSFVGPAGTNTPPGLVAALTTLVQKLNAGEGTVSVDAPGLRSGAEHSSNRRANTASTSKTSAGAPGHLAVKGPGHAPAVAVVPKTAASKRSKAQAVEEARKQPGLKEPIRDAKAAVAKTAALPTPPQPPGAPLKQPHKRA
jgi:hypothetical protein